MDHPYYDSDKRKRSQGLSYVLVFVVFLASIMVFTYRYIIPWEDRNGFIPVMKTEAVPYEPVIIGDHEVLLISNEFDTIYMEIINAYNLASEWEINIKLKR